jgi:hypothetical protein
MSQTCFEFFKKPKTYFTPLTIPPSYTCWIIVGSGDNRDSSILHVNTTEECKEISVEIKGDESFSFTPHRGLK